MEKLEDFVAGLDRFESQSATAKLELFAWFLHTQDGRERISAADLNACFDLLHIKRPENTSGLLRNLCVKKPARMLKDQRGYRLSLVARTDCDARYPRTRASQAAASSLLSSIPDRLTLGIHKTFFDETLGCFHAQAYRAAIVMMWNLTFSYVCDRLFTRIEQFNAQLIKMGAKDKPITKRADFEDMKEGRILEIAKAAGMIGASSYKVLLEKLNKRNNASHPSSTVFTVVSAEEVIFDLAENILLKEDL